jgi:hypothetical protein
MFHSHREWWIVAFSALEVVQTKALTQWFWNALTEAHDEHVQDSDTASNEMNYRKIHKSVSENQSVPMRRDRVRFEAHDASQSQTIAVNRAPPRTYRTAPRTARRNRKRLQYV